MNSDDKNYLVNSGLMQIPGPYPTHEEKEIYVNWLNVQFSNNNLKWVAKEAIGNTEIALLSLRNTTRNECSFHYSGIVLFAPILDGKPEDDNGAILIKYVARKKNSNVGYQDFYNLGYSKALRPYTTKMADLCIVLNKDRNIMFASKSLERLLLTK
jgi:hypothetical protein